MKIKNASILIIITSLLLITVAGCSENSLSAPEKKATVSVIVKKRNADFWNVVKMGTEAASKEFNVNVVFSGPTDERDIDGQIKMVNEAIDKNTGAVVLAASDSTKLVEVTEKAFSRKIPVIIIDSGVNSDKIRGFVGTDNVDAGRKLGETLVNKAGNRCKVVIMSFVKGAATSDEREMGVSEIIRQYPGIKVVSKLYCNSDENIAQELTSKVLKENSGIDAFVCLNAYGTIGTARAISELKLNGKVKIIGFDSTPEEIGFMENGTVQALVIQNPFSMGYLGVKYAIDAINGRKLPKLTNTGSKVIDKDNMYMPENQKLLFPFTN